MSMRTTAATLTAALAAAIAALACTTDTPGQDIPATTVAATKPDGQAAAESGSKPTPTSAEVARNATPTRTTAPSNEPTNTPTENACTQPVAS